MALHRTGRPVWRDKVSHILETWGVGPGNRQYGQACPSLPHQRCPYNRQR